MIYGYSGEHCTCAPHPRKKEENAKRRKRIAKKKKQRVEADMQTLKQATSIISPRRLTSSPHLTPLITSGHPSSLMYQTTPHIFDQPLIYHTTVPSTHISGHWRVRTQSHMHETHVLRS